MMVKIVCHQNIVTKVTFVNIVGKFTRPNLLMMS